MRRSEREVTDPARIRAIIQDCHCCRLGFADGQGVYIVPMSFGCREEGEARTFYFHGAKEGRKAALIAQCPRVGFELDGGYELIRQEAACGHSARYHSVIGTGRIFPIQTLEEKALALEAIMAHTTGQGGWDFPEKGLDATLVFRLEVEELTCKERL